MTDSGPGSPAHHVIVCGPDPREAKGGIGAALPGYFAALDSAGLSYESLTTFRPGSLSGKWLPWLLALPEVVKRVRNARKKGLRPIVYSHVGAMPSMLREMVIMMLGRLSGARAIVQVHAMHMDAYMNRAISRALVRILLSPADAILALTPWWKNRFLDGGMPLPIFVVPNPLPPELETEAGRSKESGGTSDNIVVLIMTRLIEGKGADVVIRALKQTPGKVSLIVAGDGDQLPDLRRLADQYHETDRVRFTGWVSGAEKTELYRRADLFCLPTKNDVFPVCIVEAMTFGLPIVSSHWGGIPDLVTDEDSGILCAPDDVSAVAAAIERLMEDGLRKAMSSNAKRRVLELCSANSAGHSLKNIVESLP